MCKGCSMPFPFSIELLLSLMTFLFIYMIAIFAFMLYWRSRREQQRREFEDQNETLESKLRLMGESATRASSLAKQIDIEIEAMTAAAMHAKDDAEKARKIAELTTEEREAVASMVRQELGGQLQGKSKKDFWIQAGLGAFFFVLGIITSNVVPLVFQS